MSINNKSTDVKLEGYITAGGYIIVADAFDDDAPYAKLTLEESSLRGISELDKLKLAQRVAGCVRQALVDAGILVDPKQQVLRAERDFFVRNQKSLFELYPCKHIAIVGENVVCAGDSPAEVYRHAIAAGHRLGTFLIDYCGTSTECVAFHGPRFDTPQSNDEWIGQRA